MKAEAVNYHEHLFYAQELYRMINIDDLPKQIEFPQLSDDGLYLTDKVNSILNLLRMLIFVEHCCYEMDNRKVSTTFSLYLMACSPSLKLV